MAVISRGARRYLAVLALMLSLVTANQALAQSKGSLRPVGTQPINVQLARGEADFGVTVRNDSGFRKAVRMRIVLDSGGFIPVGPTAVNLTVADQNLAFVLSATPSPIKLRSHDVTHASLHLKVTPAPSEAVTGVLVATAPGPGIAPLTVPITIAKAPAAAESRLTKARVAPESLTIVVRRWWPSFSHGDDHDDKLIGDAVKVRAGGIASGTRTIQESFQDVDISGDTGGRARLGVTTEEISRAATTAKIAVDPASVDRRGTYEATVALDPGLDKSPTFTVTVLASDHWIWPLLALLLGAALAYWNVTSRERVRPQRVLQLALTRAQARDAENAKAAASLAQPYTLSGLFPGVWDCNVQGQRPPALDLYCRIDDAASEEELDVLGTLVADLEARVNLWPSVCAKAQALKELTTELKEKLPRAAAMLGAAEALLKRDDATTPADEARTKGYIEALDDQIAASREWLSADKLLDEGLRWFEQLGEEAPREHDPARWRPDLETATGLDDLKRCAIIRGLCRDVHVLRTLVIQQDPTARHRLLEGSREPDAVAGTELENLLRLASIGRTPPAGAGPAVTKHLVSAIGTIDRLLFAVALTITTVAYLALVYTDTYGSLIDYLTAFAAGAGATYAANWKLLPWYGKLKPPKAGTAAPTS